MLKPYILLSLVTFCVGQTIGDTEDMFQLPKCSAKAGLDQCSRSDVPKSRQKRLVTIPNLTTLGFQSRLIVPQPPIGFYLIWIKTRFFIRALFTESILGQSGNAASLAFSGRSLNTGNPEDPAKTVAENQIEIFERVERSLDSGGLSGRQCVLRTICELKETPLNEWTVLGELIHNVIMPKSYNHSKLDVYKKAEKRGSEHGNCWSAYPKCPISIFNFLPDVYTKDDNVTVSFDPPETETAEEEKIQKNEDDLNADIDELFKQGKIIKEFNLDLDLTDINM